MDECLDNELSFNNGVDLKEDKTNMVFIELLNQTSYELYPDYLKFSSLKFFVTMMHVKVLNGWSNKCFDMMFKIIKRVFPMCGTNIPSLFYVAKQKIALVGLRFIS